MLMESDDPSVSPLITFEGVAAFDDLHTNDAGRLLAESDEPLFHEAGVWIPHSSEWLVTSNRLLPGTPDTHVQISAIHHLSGAVRRLDALEKAIVMANGGTSDFAGGAYLWRLSQLRYRRRTGEILGCPALDKGVLQNSFP